MGWERTPWAWPFKSVPKQIAWAWKEFALNPCSIIVLLISTWSSCNHGIAAVALNSDLMERGLGFTVSTSMLEASNKTTTTKKKINPICCMKEEKIIFLVLCVESCCCFLLSLWSYQLSNFITLQIQWKWSLLWRGNWDGDQMIQFLSQTRGGNLPLISFHGVTFVGFAAPVLSTPLLFCTARKRKIKCQDQILTWEILKHNCHV